MCNELQLFRSIAKVLQNMLYYVTNCISVKRKKVARSSSSESGIILRCLGLLDVVHLIRGKPWIAPGITAVGRRGWNRKPSALGVDPDQNGVGSRGRRPFLPGPLSPLPTSHSPAMVRTGRKGFNPTKSKSIETKSMVYFLPRLTVDLQGQVNDHKQPYGFFVNAFWTKNARAIIRTPSEHVFVAPKK